MTKRSLKIKFMDFWPEFDSENNYFSELLSRRYDIYYSSDPDLVFHSICGYNFRNYKCLRICYIGENERPNFTFYDFAFSFDYDTYNNRNYRFPYYALCKNRNAILERGAPRDILNAKAGFCNFLVTNHRGKERIRFFKKLSKYKQVDSGGKFMNNIGYRVDDKLEWISRYKFTLAFENSSYPGYTTEKIFEPFIAGSLPIYWGNPKVGVDFNPKSFINVHDFSSFDEAVEYIKYVDQNDELYLNYMKENCFYNAKCYNSFIDEEAFLDFFDYIYYMKDKIAPVGGSWRNNLISIKIYGDRFFKYYLKNVLQKVLPEFG